jgi:DNA topoisomerase-1
VSDRDLLDRINGLAIPPAWDEVRIAANPRTKIQAEGRDATGKKQYIYSSYHVAHQDAMKFSRTVQFGLKLPTLRRRVKTDLKRRRYDKEKVVACAVALMDRAYLRVGNEKYAKEHASYGLTTLRRKHVLVKDDVIVFDFIGKSGKNQHIEIKDEAMARMVKRLDTMRGHELFRYYDEHGELTDLKSEDVNRYIRDTIGDDFSAKDFRTWGGTLMAAKELARRDRGQSETARKRDIVESVKRVADTLGNTPAVARGSYIDPYIFELYDNSDTIARTFANAGRVRRRQFLSRDEQCVVRLLSSKPKH